MCKSYEYRGLIIYKNEDSEFGSEYWSVVNPFVKDKNGKMLHAHARSRVQVKNIADCFHSLQKGNPGKYSLNTRNKACRLLGMYIKTK